MGEAPRAARGREPGDAPAAVVATRHAAATLLNSPRASASEQRRDGPASGTATRCRRWWALSASRLICNLPGREGLRRRFLVEGRANSREKGEECS